MKAYKLNRETLTSLEDVVTVIDALSLQISDGAPIYESVKKYFNIEVTPPESPLTEDQEG